MLNFCVFLTLLWISFFSSLPFLAFLSYYSYSILMKKLLIPWEFSFLAAFCTFCKNEFLFLKYSVDTLISFALWHLKNFILLTLFDKKINYSMLSFYFSAYSLLYLDYHALHFCYASAVHNTSCIPLLLPYLFACVYFCLLLYLPTF